MVILSITSDHIPGRNCLLAGKENMPIRYTLVPNQKDNYTLAGLSLVAGSLFIIFKEWRKDNNMIDQERIKFLQAIDWHLNYNFYPASMGFLFDAVVEAIDNCNNGEPDKLVTMPNAQQEPSAHIVEVLRLEDMITIDYEY